MKKRDLPRSIIKRDWDGVVDLFNKYLHPLRLLSLIGGAGVLALSIFFFWLGYAEMIKSGQWGFMLIGVLVGLFFLNEFDKVWLRHIRRRWR